MSSLPCSCVCGPLVLQPASGNAFHAVTVWVLPVLCPNALVYATTAWGPPHVRHVHMPKS